MALTAFQRRVINLIADNRRRSGESYVAGGAALNALINAPRLSHDVDVFHDTEEAVRVEYAKDRAVLEASGLTVEVLREFPAFVSARVRGSVEATELQWAYDSAFRFFPLVEDPEFGLTLHPFDLATNKVLAM